MSSDPKTVTGARFEGMTDIEKRMLGLDTGPKPVQEFFDARALAKVAKEQKMGLADLNRVAQGRDRKIGQIDRELPADVCGRRAREITAIYEPQITKLKGGIGSRAADAEANRDLYSLSAASNYKSGPWIGKLFFRPEQFWISN
jgi:hypothetical protein